MIQKSPRNSKGRRKHAIECKEIALRIGRRRGVKRFCVTFSVFEKKEPELKRGRKKVRRSGGVTS